MTNYKAEKSQTTKMNSNFIFAYILIFAFQFAESYTSGHQSFSNPWTIESQDGVLNVYLIDELANVSVAGQVVLSRVWNKSFTGPLLKCKPGDLVNLYLQNNLPSEDTNIHFHGFHVSPLPPADYVLQEFPNDGRIKLYTFTIPLDHPPGLYWYHSHAMSISEYQIFNGMSGGFIIEGLSQLIGAVGLQEQVILLRDVQIFEGKLPIRQKYQGEAATTRLVNDMICPLMNVSFNETQLWSIANIGADITYYLAWEPTDMNNTWIEGVNIYLVARDGNALNQKISITHPYVLGPANRAQFLVEFPSSRVSTKQIKFVTRNWMNGINGNLFPYTELIVVNVNEESSISSFPNLTMPALLDYRNSNITETRTMYFSESSNGETSFYINFKVFVLGRVDVRVVLGSVEKWILVNASPEAHYFHIHQGSFQVVSINGVPQVFNGYVDTVLLPAPNDGTGNIPTIVEVIIPFNDPLQVGTYIFHCHIEAHADAGMMSIIQVINPPKVDVVFLSIACPVLFIIFLVSNAYLAIQKYRERMKIKTTV